MSQPPTRRCRPISASPPTRRSPSSARPPAPGTSPRSPPPAPAAAPTWSAAATRPTAASSCGCFSTWEITRYLIPVAPAHFRRVLRANPELPQGRAETTGGARWFSLDEVLRLRAHFAAEGSRAKEYRPYRPEGLPAKICAVANFKGGVGKTSTAAHLAMSAALDGYRVLVVDLDSQGSMTSVFGGRVEDEWGTVFPLIARDYALGPARREPPPGRARRPAAAARGDARHRAHQDRRRRHPEDPLAEHRPRSAPSSTSTGPSSRSRSGAWPCAAGSSGTRSATPSRATGCSRPTTS